MQLIVARIAERTLPGWWRGLHKVNAAVEEVIYKLVNNPKFQEALNG